MLKSIASFKVCPIMLLKVNLCLQGGFQGEDYHPTNQNKKFSAKGVLQVLGFGL